MCLNLVLFALSPLLFGYLAAIDVVDLVIFLTIIMPISYCRSFSVVIFPIEVIPFMRLLAAPIPPSYYRTFSVVKQPIKVVSLVRLSPIGMSTSIGFVITSVEVLLGIFPLRIVVLFGI